MIENQQSWSIHKDNFPFSPFFQYYRRYSYAAFTMSSAAFIPPVSWILLLAIVNLIVIVACAAFVLLRSKQAKRRAAQLNSAIREYFRRSGVEVNVDSARLGNDPLTYTAFIESEPMKRFRLSHIIEMTLREHVAKACDIHLDKIYWRFPLKEVPSSAPAVEKQAAADPDTYINEGLVYYRDLPKGDVQEVSWEKFEESAAMNSVINSDESTPSQTH